MIIAATHTEAIAQLIADLDNGQNEGIGPDNVPLHLPPMDQRPMGLPAIIISFPTIAAHERVLCGQGAWRFTFDVMVVSESTVGLRLAGICDALIQVLNDHNYRVESSSLTGYDLPDSPSPIPSVTFTVE